MSDLENLASHEFSRRHFFVLAGAAAASCFLPACGQSSGSKSKELSKPVYSFSLQDSRMIVGRYEMYEYRKESSQDLISLLNSTLEEINETTKKYSVNATPLNYKAIIADSYLTLWLDSLKNLHAKVSLMAAGLKEPLFKRVCENYELKKELKEFSQRNFRFFKKGISLDSTYIKRFANAAFEHNFLALSDNVKSVDDCSTPESAVQTLFSNLKQNRDLEKIYPLHERDSMHLRELANGEYDYFLFTAVKKETLSIRDLELNNEARILSDYLENQEPASLNAAQIMIYGAKDNFSVNKYFFLIQNQQKPWLILCDNTLILWKKNR